MGLLSPESKAVLSSGVVHLAVLVELEFSTGTERYWSGVHELTHEGRRLGLFPGQGGLGIPRSRSPDGPATS